MKWMWSTTLVAVTISAAVNAQSSKEMAKPMMGDKMNMTYAGCIEAVNHGGAFLLTHVGDDQTAMPHDGRMKAPSSSASMEGAPRRRYAAVAFDYFVLFNPDSVVSAVERVFPGKGRALTDIWRTRQFEYSWLRSLAGRYVDFSAVTEDALVYAASAMNVQLTVAQKRQLLDAYLQLTAWPDTADALRRLRASDVRVITIANFSPTMLRANADHAGLTALFDALVSTDANHTYKPDPRAYQLGLDRLQLAKQDIVFAAFGGWDAAGAKSFGYPTVWVNRFNQPHEELGVRPDRTVSDLSGLLDFVLQ